MFTILRSVTNLLEGEIEKTFVNRNLNPSQINLRPNNNTEKQITKINLKYFL